ncbi:hypothetical protein [Haloterrigena salifodinae]|uniref:hypothetical protein n=1 Tax=Haloterrigena salifodinae TaxID=2675099 RepID=UPI000F866452|nr:hypothetical protein [Haloterrigena salifodinae]
MTGELSTDQRRRYRELMNRSMGLGVAGALGATALSVVASKGNANLFAFAGVGLYYLGVVGYLAIWQRTGVRLFDEREAEIERRAGHIVWVLVSFVAIFGLPADLVLDATDAVDVPLAIRGTIWGYALLVAVGLIVYGYVERRYT